MASRESFYEFLEAWHPEKRSLVPDLRQHLSSVLREQEYPKNHHLLHADQVPVYCWYLLNGSARVYFYEPSQRREVTTWFWHKGDLILPFKGFFEKTEAGEIIQLLEDSKLLLLHSRDLQETTSQFPQFRLIERALQENYHKTLYKGYLDLLVFDHRHRYIKLNSKHPSLFNKALLKDIATYLKMHPKTLSHLRADKTLSKQKKTHDN